MQLNFKLLLLACLPIGVVQGQGNSDCAQWCKKNFPKPGDVCTDPASEGKGPCYKCGPKKTSSSMQLCSGSCTDTSTDNANCGSCGNACPSSKYCSGGVCKFRACTNPFSCGGAPTYCGSGPPGSLCVCFSSSGEEGNFCLDVTQLGGCPPTQCTTNASCPSGKVCVSSCCGKTCAAVSASGVCNLSGPSKLFRRQSKAEIAASSPYLNRDVAENGDD